MTSMVERVAKILDPEVWKDDIPFPTRDGVVSFYQRRQLSAYQAREVIEAMRQPTAFMADSGDEIFRSILASRYYTIPVWHSMIDAALKETTNAHDR